MTGNLPPVPLTTVYIASLALARFDSHVDYIMISLQDSGGLK